MGSTSIATQEMGSHETPTTTVVNAVAEIEGIDATELEPLYERIDTDALNVLLDSPKSQIKVAFKYGEYLVEVTKDGDVTVEVGEFTEASSEIRGP
ncbi:hypothetical protein CV102_24280 [Natronococcus pandeyae]|uniref:Halobacterial output domain-containing protein n=1 Tax=Natronococcus pandeyae TaxID=2055836 RepID=A0A8J8PYC6_9EURY|nr:HalOD1 output domain-containing protein [Natronococcus pandeyae]TYL36061.1 hypothetical protein CV102_24280 [Natronococcus pandeyae]